MLSDELVFSNIYSKFRSKTLHYAVRVEKSPAHWFKIGKNGDGRVYSNVYIYLDSDYGVKSMEDQDKKYIWGGT